MKEHSEDALIERPAIALFGALGWRTVNAFRETYGAGGTLGRETRAEVVLAPCLRAALARLNPGLSPDAIEAAVAELTRDRASPSSIDEYSAGSINVEEFFRRLVAFARELTTEERRAVAQGLSEEELAVFDLLTRPEPALARQDEERVKKVARDLLATLKREKLTLDWRKRQQARAQVRVAIEEALDQGLPETYDGALYRRKCDAVYQHVFDAYAGAGRGAYALSA
jgi:type I site-specific restriction-modification system R (restriction) subunit